MALWSNFCRLSHIIRVLLRHLIAYLAGKVLVRFPQFARCFPYQTIAGPERLRLVFEEVGGTFIKFGQMLALQPDILPLEYCNALFKLLDRINPFEFEEVERLFAEQFGHSPMELYDHFDPNPIATASIGQVYIAYLGERKLAVKVQRPNVHNDFAGDIRLMSATVRCIQVLRLKQLYWMLEPLSEFIAWTQEELDFRFEMRYMEELRRNSSDNQKEHIPEVLKDYSTHCILTLEFLEGMTLLNYIRALETSDELAVQSLYNEGFVPADFAKNLIENFLNDAFRHGIFHADLHPANLMILPNSVVGYIDFGITGVLSSYLRRHLVALTLGYSRGDLDAMYSAFFKVSALDADSDVEGFRRGLQTLSDEWYVTEGKEQRLLKNITLVMLDLLKLSRQTGVWPERDVIKYIRSAIAIDGLITRFEPGFDVGKYLETVCNRYLKWYGYQDLFAFDSLVDLSSASGHLLHDGVLRAASMMERAASGDFPGHIESYRAVESNHTLQHRIIQTAVVIFSVTLLMVVTNETVQFGLNLFTAEMLVITFSIIKLFKNLYQII